MEVILLEKVQNLGRLGDKVSVKSGYARNFLIPQSKAVVANASNTAAFETRRAALEKAEFELLTLAQNRRGEIEGKVITIAAKAGDEGKLFGSIGTVDIADAAAAAGMNIARHEIRLSHGAFRQIGDFAVEVHLHPDVNANITVRIVSEE